VPEIERWSNEPRGTDRSSVGGGSLPVECCYAKTSCLRHCEKRSDEAISNLQQRGLLRSLRSLAMTQQQHPRGRLPEGEISQLRIMPPRRSRGPSLDQWGKRGGEANPGSGATIRRGSGGTVGSPGGVQGQRPCTGLQARHKRSSEHSQPGGSAPNALANAPQSAMMYLGSPPQFCQLDLFTQRW
jgi:hypothetical protein